MSTRPQTADLIVSAGRGATRSIGEVLAALKQEFSDITISKIRFLEGQGLITPERTASGYRKFSESDIDRLRYVLRQQRDNFLPLKVIKQQLEARAEAAAVTADITGADGVITITDETLEDASSGPIARDELAKRSGLTESQIRELEGFSLLQGQCSGSAIWYDNDALEVARLAARFLQFGIEARHLRSFKTAAAREADLYRQLASPVRTQRNTQARMEAVARLEELLRLGAAMRDELLRQALNAD